MEYLWVLLITLAWLKTVMSVPCPSRPWPCRCDETRKIVFCNERKLWQVPQGIPSDTKVLHLQGNFLENNHRLERSLEGLTALERLDMHNNRLTSFPRKLPESLVYLSLRRNSIRYIGRNALTNLRNLKELHLDSNNITNRGVAQNAFASANNLEDLVISLNNLTSLPEGLPGNLKSVRLDHNKINVVSTRSLQPLRKVLVLDLSYNNLTGNLKGLNYLRSLKTLHLNHNKLVDLPSALPRNLTELHLGSNNIQFIYTNSHLDHGDLQELNKLGKLDLSSNHLKSVEKGAFAALPVSLSIELHDNPWNCDCNLVYLKRWLIYTSSIFSTRESSMQCFAPAAFAGVKLNEIDVEDLRCAKSSYEIEFEKVQSTSVVIKYDALRANEPPYVTFSAMYGAMLCENCTLRSDVDTTSEYRASMWIEPYTIIPLPSGIPTEITGLKPNTQYAICIVTSYQHPDHIGLEQCESVRTFAPITTVEGLLEPGISRWVWIIAVAIGLLAILILIITLWYRQRKRRSLHSYVGARPRKRDTPVPYAAGKSLPFVDANPEFNVTLMVHKDLQRCSDNCGDDSHDETMSTTHSGSVASRNGHTNRNSHCDFEQCTMQTTPFLPGDSNCSVRANNISGYYV